MHVIFVIMLIFFCTLNLFVRLFVKFILWSSSVNLTLYLHLEVLQVFLRRHREDFSICVQKQKLTNNLYDYFVYVTRRYYRWIVTRPNQSWFIWLCIHINYMQFLKFCFKLTCKKKSFLLSNDFWKYMYITHHLQKRNGCMINSDYI